jgi:hypothetical protein
MMIQLKGGPHDGTIIDWSGGDVATFPAGPPILDFSVITVEPFREDVHIYRRSLKTPTIFVYQP